jgi:hypothetical protein
VYGADCVIVLFVSIVVSMEINRRRCFRSDPRICTELVKIALTLMDYFSSADRRTPWVNISVHNFE